MERDVSLIIPGRAWREQGEACSIASVTKSSMGENDATENILELGHPSGMGRAVDLRLGSKLELGS